MRESRMTEDERLIERIEKAAREGAKEGVVDTLKKNGKLAYRTGRALLIKIIVVAVIAIIVVFGVTQLHPFQKLRDQLGREEDVEGHDLTLKNNGFWGYTVADFSEVILGDSEQLKKLEVFSQDMTEMVELTKAGLGKIKLFSKSKFYTYHGTATFIVDLGKLNDECIELDEENQIVILKIPHAVAKIDITLEEMEIGDTQKGMLAFGELSMNDEDSKKLYSEAKKNMEEKLISDNVQEKADRMAKMSVWEIYQPMITEMAKGYSLEIQFMESK